MKVKQRVLAALLGCALVGVSVALVWQRWPKEPVYEGKKLSEWVLLPNRRGRHGYGGALANSERERAIAIRAIGTNAIPYALRWLAYKRPGWKDVLERLPLTQSISGALQERTFKADQLAIAAPCVFEILGPAAAGAVPALSKMANDPANARFQSIIGVLPQLGEDGLKEMGLILENAPLERANAAAGCMSRTGTAGVNLENQLPSIFVYYARAMKAQRYSIVAIDPIRNITAIGGCITHSNVLVRLGALHMLASVADFHREAIEPIRTALVDSNLSMRMAATNVMLMYAPGPERLQYFHVQ